jgi:hypothetical protein
MANLDCPLDWIDRCLGDQQSTPLGESVQAFQRGLEQEASDLINGLIHWWICNTMALLGGGGELEAGPLEEVGHWRLYLALPLPAAALFCFVSNDVSCSVKTPPHPIPHPRHDGMTPLKPGAKINRVGKQSKGTTPYTKKVLEPSSELSLEGAQVVQHDLKMVLTPGVK